MYSEERISRTQHESLVPVIPNLQLPVLQQVYQRPDQLHLHLEPNTDSQSATPPSTRFPPCSSPAPQRCLLGSIVLRQVLCRHYWHEFKFPIVVMMQGEIPGERRQMTHAFLSDTSIPDHAPAVVQLHRNGKEQQKRYRPDEPRLSPDASTSQSSIVDTHRYRQRVRIGPCSLLHRHCRLLDRFPNPLNVNTAGLLEPPMACVSC